MRPIAVGCTFLCLAAKVAGRKIRDEMGELLVPQQLGFGVSGGSEAAIHAARIYLCHLGPGKAVLKLDFRNVFNTIHRDKMLSAVLEHAPCLHPFLHSVYSSSSITLLV